MLRLALLAGTSLGIFVSSATADAPFVHDYEGYNAGLYGTNPNQTFVSSPLVAPRWQVNTWDVRHVDVSKPYVFNAFPMDGQLGGPMVFSSTDLSLVYANPTAEISFNARVQQYNGVNYLTYWAGKHNSAAGYGEGYCYFQNETYDTVYTIAPIGLPTGVMADQHECQMTRDGSVIISMYMKLPFDLTSVGGPANGTLIDSGFQEIDLATNTSLFTWWARDHFNLTDSYEAYSGPEYEWFHLNSVEKVDGNYLVSGRLLRTVTYVNGTTGKSIWTLGGRKNQFRDISDGNALSFGYQHHVRFRNQDLTRVSMFDNHQLVTLQNCETNCSRGLELELDFRAQTVRVAAEYYHPDKISTGAEGSFQPQPNRNTLVGWGMNPTLTEYTPQDKCVWDVQYGPWGINQMYGDYRVFKGDWVGRPTWPPSAAIQDRKVYVSWNGATEVVKWQMYTGRSKHNLRPSHKVNKEGFETVISIPKRMSGTVYMRIDALDAWGHCLGSTETLVMDA